VSDESLNTKQVSVFAVLEADYGVDPQVAMTPLLMNTGATSTIQVDTVKREVLDNNFGSFGNAIVGKRWEKTYQQELKGIGFESDSVIEPEFSLLMQACGQEKAGGYVIVSDVTAGTWQLGDTVNNTTAGQPLGVIEFIDGDTLYVRVTGGNVPAVNDSLQGGSGVTGNIHTVEPAITYSPVSDGHQSATIYHYEGGDNGMQKVGLGARGSATLNCTVKALPVIDWKVSALYKSPLDAPTPTMAGSCVRPSPLVNVKVKIGSINMEKIKFTDFMLDFGNDVQQIDDMQAEDGIAAVEIVDANPTLKIKFSAPKLGTYNPYADLGNETVIGCSITYGLQSGQRVMLAVPFAQIESLGENADKNRKNYDLSMTCNKSCSGSARKHCIFVY